MYIDNSLIKNKKIKRAKDLNIHFFKEDMQMVNRHENRHLPECLLSINQQILANQQIPSLLLVEIKTSVAPMKKHYDVS